MDEQLHGSQQPASHGGYGSKNSFPIFIVVLIILVVGALMISSKKPSTLNSTPDAHREDTNAKTDAMVYTLDDVAMHNTPNDCWFAIEGNVYDVTAFIASGNHAGGDAIVQGCGLDATELFNTRPMGSGTPHSDQARNYLPRFEIGVLAE